MQPTYKEPEQDNKMKKLLITSTLVFLGYVVVVKIISSAMWVMQQTWELQGSGSLSMDQVQMLWIMDGSKDVLTTVGGALFVFLVVNILVTAYGSKHKDEIKK